MDGSSLKTLIIPLDDSLANIARKLEMTPQSLDNMLKTKDIKTGIIERLSRIYKKPVSYFFNEENKLNIEINAKNHSGASANGDVVVVNDGCKKDYNAIIKDLNDKIKERDDKIKELEHKIELQNKDIEGKDNSLTNMSNTISKMEDTISILKTLIPSK